MTNLENAIIKKITDLIPKYEKLEIKASISDNAYSVVFYATIDGERFQNYEMADKGVVDDKAMEKLTAEIAELIRSEKTDYISGEINKVFFDVTK